MADLQSCPNCGQPKAAHAPRGLCPRCLLEQGLAGSVTAGGQTEPPSRLYAVSVSLEPVMQTAEQVLAVYRRISTITGLVILW